MRPLLTLALVACALPICNAATAQAPDPATDWSRVRQAVWARTVIVSPGQPDRNARILFVDDTSLTFEDLDRALGAKFMMMRHEVAQISKWTGRNGSLRGAVLGSAGGLLVGYVVAKKVGNSFSGCATTCVAENALVYTSLFAPAIAGGVLGYRLPGGNRRLVIIYVRP